MLRLFVYSWGVGSLVLVFVLWCWWLMQFWWKQSRKILVPNLKWTQVIHNPELQLNRKWTPYTARKRLFSRNNLVSSIYLDSCRTSQYLLWSSSHSGCAPAFFWPSSTSASFALFSPLTLSSLTPNCFTSACCLLPALSNYQAHTANKCQKLKTIQTTNMSAPIKAGHWKCYVWFQRKHTARNMQSCLSWLWCFPWPQQAVWTFVNTEWNMVNSCGCLLCWKSFDRNHAMR